MGQRVDEAVDDAAGATMRTVRFHEYGEPGAIHGAGGTIGHAAVQIALRRGMTVIATAGETHAGQLRDLGATVTSYGPGLVERVLEINGGPVDLALDTAPVGGTLPDLIRLVDGDPRRVMTISDFEAAAQLGVRHTFDNESFTPVEALPEFGQLAAEGSFVVPIAGTFPLQEWRTVLEISQGGRARGKLVLLPTAPRA